MITIERIDPIHAGDWHDKPLRYEVRGPAAELQRFGRKKDALKYASLRRRSADQHEAFKRYIRS